MPIYRADVGLRVEVTSAEPLTERELRILLEPHAAQIVPDVSLLTAVAFLEEPRISFDTPYCAAPGVRRNSVDGWFYQCQYTAAVNVHASVEACSAERGAPCDKPEEHHEYVSPGWDEPVPEPAEVPA